MKQNIEEIALTKNSYITSVCLTFKVQVDDKKFRSYSLLS